MSFFGRDYTRAANVRLANLLRRLFRAAYYQLYGESGKRITINNEPYTVSAHVSRGVNSVIDETPLKLLLKLSKTVDVVFDVGANVGIIALITAKQMKPGSVIYSFEPAPVSYAYLADTARVHNGNATIIPQNYAVSNSNGRLYFTNDGTSCTNHVAGEDDADVIAVDAITLDWFCETHGVVPQVVKVDIEGAEYWALQGMRQTLSNNDCKVLVEVHQEALKAAKINGHMFADLIESVGYRAFDTSGDEIGSDEVMMNACVILARRKPWESYS